MARLALAECQSRELPAAVLLRFVTEGDNAQPAVELGMFCAGPVSQA